MSLRQDKSPESAHPYQLDEQLPVLVARGLPGQRRADFETERYVIRRFLEDWLLPDMMRSEAKLTPSQRAALSQYFPPTSELRTQRGKALKRMISKLEAEPLMGRIGTQFGGEIRIIGQTLISTYDSQLWQVALTTLPNRDTPLGLLFSATSLMSLVWAEIHWCALNDVGAAFCKGCDGLFAQPPRRKRGAFCSRRCWETHQERNDSNRKTLKSMHQHLTRLAGKAERVAHSQEKAWMATYIRRWKEYEQVRQGNRRQVLTVHPAMVAVKLPMGRELVSRVQESAQLHDKDALEYDFNELEKWLGVISVPIPTDFRKNIRKLGLRRRSVTAI